MRSRVNFASIDQQDAAQPLSIRRPEFASLLQITVDAAVVGCERLHRRIEVFRTNIQSDLQRLYGQRHADKVGNLIDQLEAEALPVDALRGEQVVGEDVLIQNPECRENDGANESRAVLAGVAM